MRGMSRSQFVRFGTMALAQASLLLADCGQQGSASGGDTSGEGVATEWEATRESEAGPEGEGVWVLSESAMRADSPDGKTSHVVYSYVRDERGNLLEIPPYVTDADRGSHDGRTYACDENGWHTELVTTEPADDDQEGRSQTTTYHNEYDERGLLIARTYELVGSGEDASTQECRETYAYNEAGYLVGRQIETEGGTNASLQVFAYDDNGYETSWSYEPLEGNDGLPTEGTVSYEWDAEGHPLRAVIEYEDGDKVTNEYTTDENGSIVACAVRSFNDGFENPWAPECTYRYAFVEHPSLAVRVEAHQHDFIYS